MMISYFGLASPRGCLIKFVTVLFLIYFPMAAGCYFALGDQVKDNIVTAMSTGWQRVVVEIMLHCQKRYTRGHIELSPRGGKK